VTLRRRTALGLLLGAGVVAPGRALEPWPVAFGGPVDLVDQHGRRRRDTDFRGSWLLLQFGYAACPDVCPLGLETMTAALAALGPLAARVQPLFITIDPERDTLQALAGLAAGFDPRLLALTGGEAETRAVARAYRVHRRKVLLDPARSQDYVIDHGSLTYLVGPDGRFVTLFPYGTDADRMAQVIAGYLGA
jgi:protein SCO1/2